MKIVRGLHNLSDGTQYSELEDGTCVSYDQKTHEMEVIPDGFDAVADYIRNEQEERQKQSQYMAQMRKEVTHDIYGYPIGW